MTQPPQPTEPFAQHSRLAELVTALGFRRYPLFLPGSSTRNRGVRCRATAVASRDGDLVLRRRRGVRAPRARPDLAAVRRRPHRAVPEDPGGRLGRPQPGVLRPRGGRLDRGPPQHQRDRHRAAGALVPARAATARHHPFRGARGVPLEVTDALLDEFRRLADRHQRGFMVEQVMELLATS